VKSGWIGHPAAQVKIERSLFWSASMISKSVLTLSDVRAMAEAAQAEALAQRWPVTIAIVDDGGHLLWLQRLDGAAPITAHIAPAKARTAALGRRESKVYEDVINQGRTAFLSAPLLEGMLEGGVPVMVDGQCVGAVGVSGVKSNEDAQVARAGIAALAAVPLG
jgi:glc operon protein GlcG